MKKYKKLISFSFRDYGDCAGVWDDRRKTFIFLGDSGNSQDMATACQCLAGYLLEMAHNYEHAKDFCAPEFDKEHREIQLDAVRHYMTPIFEGKESEENNENENS